MKLRWMAAALSLLVLAGCGQAVPTPPPASTAPAGAQEQVCGRLDADQCAEVIRLVERQVPDTARSTLAVADLESPPGNNSYGAFLALVAFAPWDPALDIWFSPPTWIVSKSATGWTVEPWRENALPAHFVDLLRSAGIQG